MGQLLSKNLLATIFSLLLYKHQQWRLELKDGSLTVTNIDDNREILKVNGAMVLKFSDDPNEQLQLIKFAAWTRTELGQARASHTQQLNKNRSRSRGRGQQGIAPLVA